MRKYSIELKWGVVFAVVFLLWMMMEKQLGWHDVHIADHATYTMLFMIPTLLIYFFGLKEKRTRYYSGSMTWLQGFTSGILIAVVVAILTPLTQYLVSYHISPDYFDNAKRYAIDNGLLTSQLAEKHFNFSSYVFQGVVGALVTGAITSALMALLLRRK